jgi:hypothetical protein
VTPKGWEFLGNIDDKADPARSEAGSGPLDDRGTIGDEAILTQLAPLRTARIWLADTPPPPTATDLLIHRVMLTGGRDATVEVRRRQ